MKQLFILAIIFCNCAQVKAQSDGDVKAETIESFITKLYSDDGDWYEKQTLAWQKIVEANPTNQWAWRNYFHASYYDNQLHSGWGDHPDKSRTADIIRKMEETLPDSYVLNLCKGRFCLSTDSAARRGDNLYRAVELMPEDACAEDIEDLACRLWAYNPDNKIVGELFRKVYEKKYFPQRIMLFNWNILKSMQKDALYFANGDVLLVPIKIQQEALGERTDVTVIPLSYLHSESFRKSLFKKLNIPSITLEVNDYGKYGDDWSKQYYADIIKYLIHESKRPAYFSTDMLSWTSLEKDSLYNEGLVLKYSDKQYNNFAVAMNNAKNVYHLEYLAEPNLVNDTWGTSEHLDLNNVTLLSNLIGRLRKNGDKEEAERLYKIFEKCIERSRVDLVQKEHIFELLKEQKQ